MIERHTKLKDLFTRHNRNCRFCLILFYVCMYVHICRYVYVGIYLDICVCMHEYVVVCIPYHSALVNYGVKSFLCSTIYR